MEIQCTINHQTLTIEQRKLANHSQKYLEISFDFKTDDWNGLTKFALFTSQGKTYRVPITNGKATAPTAVLTGDRFSIGVYGLGEDELRVTTNQCRFSLAESGYTTIIENDIPPEDPTIVEQIFEALDGKSDVGHNHPKNEINDLIIDILPSEENRMDLNDYIDYGLYRMPNRANWDYVDNFPDIPKLSSGFAFLLDVENGINAERTDPCRQTLTIHDVSDPRIFYRVLRKWDTQDTHVYNWSDWCEISKTGHNHDERYYTETEVNQIVTDLKKLFLNRLILGSINDSLQIDESMDIVAQLIVNGIPSENETIYFYEKLQAI